MNVGDRVKRKRGRLPGTVREVLTDKWNVPYALVLWDHSNRVESHNLNQLEAVR